MVQDILQQAMKTVRKRWFSFLVGFAFPLMWYYATFLYFGNYYQRDPRERAGLADSAIAAMGFSLVLLIIAAILAF
ncbi:hypothetical protein L1987_59801 [Smallanthus sonchifolius]|uniref:Uncharacterized protein n=1 Tax=Smallanthus sonchifolius TaxID=185202 RepID=A0ACB9D701_9ASTR|nr:hypothetical protein L1987_59801 [Smallanthus sonchifolius]